MIVDGIKIVKQKRNNTCGYASASMLLDYFQVPDIDEDYLFENEPFDENGITFYKLLEIYEKHLKGYTATTIHEDVNRTLEIIKQSLSENMPLQVLYLTENLLGNHEPVLHYAVLTGYDEENGFFTLADPYGFTKIISKDDFFEAISFRNDCLPEFIKNAMPSNIMIKFSKSV